MRAAVATLLLLFFACGEDRAPDARPAAAPIQTPADLVAALNRYRKEDGATPLQRSDVLERAAAGHAQEMGRLGYFSNYSPTPGRRTPDDRLALEGWPEGRRFFEMLGAGTGRHVYGLWTSKPELAAAVRDPAYRALGLGHARRNGKADVWVLLLGAGG